MGVEIIVPLGFFALIAFICSLGIISDLVSSLVGRTSKKSTASEEESQMMQELYTGLTKMDARMEALETILLERESRRDK